MRTVPIDQLAPRLASEFCSKVFECCSLATIQYRIPSIKDDASCRYYFGDQIDQVAVRWSAAIDAGTLSYDEAAVAQDIAALRAMACTDFYRVLEPRELIENAVSGSVINGGSCTTREQCVSRYCERQRLTCAQPLPEGAFCSDYDSCEGGLACIPGGCGPLQPDGALCYSPRQCMNRGCGAPPKMDVCGAAIGCFGL